MPFWEQTVCREMTNADIQAVHTIEVESFRSPWSAHALRGELKNKLAHYLVMEHEGTIIGYAGMWIMFDEAHVTNIAIAPPYRNQRCGRRLLLKMMTWAASLGAERMTLEVRETNEHAQRLYAKCDFEVQGRRPRYYIDTGEAALIMWNDDIAATLDREKMTR